MPMRSYFSRGRMTIPRTIARSMAAPRYRRPVVSTSVLRRAIAMRAAPRPRRTIGGFGRRVARVVGSLPTLRRYR